jgi:hypothetical protein
VTLVKVQLLGSFRTRTFREQLEKEFQKIVEKNPECLKVADHYGRLNLQVVIECTASDQSQVPGGAKE